LCFSATGSFAISGVLTGLGAASIVRNKSAPHRMFAAIPFLFAAQQAAEGTVWLTIDDPASVRLHRLAVNVFLAFALAVWPMWLPLSLRFIERNVERRRILTGLVALGAVVSTYATVLLTRWQPIARIAGHSMSYEYQHREDSVIQLGYLLAYIVPTLVPFFVSTASLARTIGVTLIVSLALAVIVQREALASVWCFFAAILSGLIFLAVSRERALDSRERLLRMGT
jgi:hypothetical protein